MIATLNGILTAKGPGRCVIDVGGVGYDVHVSLSTFEKLPCIGEKAGLAIHTHVREDELKLFGFATEKEKALFLKLVSVSGVGPKMAMAMLSGLPAHDLTAAIGNEDIARLTSIPGVGKKTAERIMVELKDKLSRELHIERAVSPGGRTSIHEDAISALVNLGYNRQIAELSLRKLKVQEGTPIEDVIRQALKDICRV